MEYNHHDIISQVPVDYYQKGVEENFLQRFWHTHKLSAVLSFVYKNPKKILDTGCASGWFISRISNKFPDAECFGVDLYKDAIEYAKKRYKNISFTVADAHRLPYKNNSFDVVVSTEVIEHLNNPEIALGEIYRVLGKNGKCIIEVDSGSLLFTIVWFLWTKFTGQVWHEAHLHSFNPQKLEKLLKQVGFAVLHKKKFNFGMAMVFLAEKK